MNVSNKDAQPVRVFVGKSGPDIKQPADNVDPVKLAEEVAKRTGAKPKDVTVLDAVAEVIKPEDQTEQPSE